MLTYDDFRFGRTASLLLGIGALGLIVTCVCYAVAGPEAALPGGSTSLEAAQLATVHSMRWMRMAGLFGMPCDVLLAVGALMIAMSKRGTGASTAIAGWLAMAMAGALFIIVDAMVAFVLPAASGDGYVAVRAMFDVLFAIGAWATSLGAIAAATSNRWPEFRSRPALWVMRAAGVVGLVANSAFLLGLPGAPAIGPGVALLAVGLLLAAISSYSAHDDDVQVAATQRLA